MNDKFNETDPNLNAISGEDRYPHDWHPIDSIEMNRLTVNNNSGDNQSISSSKSSIKSNSSHRSERKTHRSTNGCQQRCLLPIKDLFCWDCHKRGVDYSCPACPRSYHQKCQSLKKSNESQLCPECVGIMEAEEGTNPSGCMQWLNGNVDRMAQLLKYTIVTVKTADKQQSFFIPVSTEQNPDYNQYIVNPMDLSLVEKNVVNKVYASTNSFLADIKWIYHNCHVFNTGGNNAVISEAKNIIRVAKQECEEIEICPDCYLNYYTLEEETYFSAVCTRPHAIVWAKLKGYPFWPAKVVRYNQTKNEVDIRFFGTHDKCWLKPENCYLMSRKYPNNKKPIKFDQVKFDEAIYDMNQHLDQLNQHFVDLFKFDEKRTVFTIDCLYLNRDQNSISSIDESKPVAETIKSSKKGHKNVLNSYNGIPYKTLKVNISQFDVRPLFKRNGSPDLSPSPSKCFNRKSLEDSSDVKSSPTKRFKHNSKKGSPHKKCFSKAIITREEMSSSLESDQSLNGSKEFSKLDNSVNSNTTCEQKSNSINKFNENRLHLSHNLSQTQTVTVSGKTSEVLNLNQNFSKRLNQEMTDQIQIDVNYSSTITDCSHKLKTDSHIKSPQNSKSHSNTNLSELLKRIKALEFKNRKLEEELNEQKSRTTTLEEENDDFKKSNEELQISIIDIKKKQWCTNCSKEAILPCCWNTCYCTVECQHQHWPTHAKSCRRRQQTKS